MFFPLHLLCSVHYQLHNHKFINFNLYFSSKNKIPVSSTRFLHSKSNKQLDEDLLNKPLKYTTSPANDWKAAHSRIGNKAEYGPWYEPHVVSASLIGFMIYFFILREENDIDLLLERPLTDTLKTE